MICVRCENEWTRDDHDKGAVCRHCRNIQQQEYYRTNKDRLKEARLARLAAKAEG